MSLYDLTYSNGNVKETLMYSKPLALCRWKLKQLSKSGYNKLKFKITKQK